MSGLRPGMEWGSGGTESEQREREATHAWPPPRTYQRATVPTSSGARPTTDW
jgi:hypothetical protein